MNEGGRHAAAIELLSLLDATTQPADGVLRAYFRKRRYIGAKDRRAVSDYVYAVVRHQARLDWWLEQVEAQAGSARSRLLAARVILDQQPADALETIFNGSGYGPPALEPEERALVERLAGATLDAPEQPEATRLELPAWLYGEFERVFGADLEAELKALGETPPVDLRVNGLKATPNEAIALLAEDDIVATPTPWSPLGLRLSGRVNLPATKAFRDGLVEVQDEGSQLATLLCDLQPEQAVADLCAGAGGKTLALAAQLAGQGRLVGLDVDAARLARAAPRLLRAGAEGVELQSFEGPDAPWLATEAASFDRVLVDAPCSGSGAWRRHPEARWRLSPAQIDEYRAAQVEALDMAAKLVRPGGRLVYITCSFLSGENQDQIDAFLARQSEFFSQNVATIAETVLGQALPGAGETLQLTPARHGTDGFYVACLERQATE